VELAQVQVQATGDSVALSFDLFVDGCIMIMWMRREDRIFNENTRHYVEVYNKLNSSSSGLQMLLKI
jgi:hypothetical protein